MQWKMVMEYLRFQKPLKFNLKVFMISWGGITDGLIQKHILKVWPKDFFFISTWHRTWHAVTLATRRQGGTLHMDSKRDLMSKNGYCQGNRCWCNYNPANKHQVLNILHMSSSGGLQSLCPKHPSVETHCLILDFNLYVCEIYRNKTCIIFF